MKLTLLTFLFLGGALFAPATVIQFDLSPPGFDAGIGLHPENEVIPGNSNGSGNEFGSGIFFDTSTGVLTLNLAYGSAFGFTDLTGPAFSWLLHGPSPSSETAPVLFNLQSLHGFANDPAQGGQIVGTVNLDSAQATDLLAGFDYINIYTPANVGGEIRGQLVSVSVSVPETGPPTFLFGMVTWALLLRWARNHRQKFRESDHL